MKFIPSAVALLALVVLDVTTALPSFGSKIPNGERVPCQDENDEGCVSGYCRGIGHPTCSGGISGQSPQLLSPFGQDWKDAGFEWTTDLCMTDSDGDGFTNGEELGDPCCVWTVEQASGDRVSSYTSDFVASHPGDANHVLPDDYERPASCDAEEMLPTPLEGDVVVMAGGAGYNEGETRGSIDFVIEPYPIPRETTTYIDFVFNLPEDMPDIVHIVYGEALVSQPKHLHHFVVSGCTSRIDEDKVGKPLDDVPGDCNVPVGGFSGWAPGVTMWEMPRNAGIPIGKKFGIQALSVNVHYTDGDAPYLNGEQAIGTDGIRVHFTPDLRPKTIVNSPVINVGFGPRDMVVEPNKKRAFMTRTCTVESSCQDQSDDTMNVVGSAVLGDPDLTCEKGASMMLCSFSDLFQGACPESCGLCGEGSPRTPDEYEAVSVFYHAHLLGREMYTTLIPQDDPGARIDLRSRDIWTYEDQTPYPLEDVVIRPGDKIQTTCVFDSTSRTESTRFDLATYDEMCLNTVSIIMDTPEIEGGDTSAAIDIQLRGFKCSTAEEGDIWLGEFGLDEDPRLVFDSHPLKDAECSFPTGLWIFDGMPSMEKRCNGEIVKTDDGMCDQTESPSFLNPTAVAGHTCEGGLFSEKDSNDGTTELQCTSGGGKWIEYDCGEAQQYLQSSDNGLAVEEKQYLLEYWWAPKCCVGGGGDVAVADDNDADDASSGTDNDDSSSANIVSHGSALLFAAMLVANLVA